MTPGRWRQIRKLLDGAMQLEGLERSAFLDRTCSGDQSLRQEVEKLLAAERELPSSFLENPALALPSQFVSSASSSLLAAGTRLGPYALEALLGTGGMGEVYRARDTRLERTVAVKVIPRSLSSDPARRQRFEREARAIALLQHPNICTLYDVGSQEGTDYLVMEYLEGQTLAARLLKGRLPLDLTVRYAAEVADALDVSHQRGIVHRDIKPGNIFITTRGETKVLDFGLAKLDEPLRKADAAATDTMLSTPGAAMGTIAYMSPEQAKGEAVDARTDIFSLGTVLYEMATGKAAFKGTSAAVLFDAILNRTPIPPAQLNPEVPSELERIIDKAIEKDREVRYQSSKEILADLKSLQRGSGSGEATAKAARWIAKPRLSRRRVVALAAAGGVTGSLALLGIKYYGSVPGTVWSDSIAVLPFQNKSSDPEIEYLSDGMTEGLINSLSELPGLRVIARPTAFTFKGKPLDLADISRMLNVRTLLVGQVSERRKALNVQADLISAKDGSELWGQQYPATADVLEVQRQIVEQLIPRLRVALTPYQRTRASARRTVNAEAYQQYLRGRYQWNQYAPEAWKKALDYFSTAIKIDPGYAPAWAGVADSYYQMSSLVLQPRDAMPKAKAAVMRALELDETMGEAYASLAMITAQYDWDGSGAEKEFRRAIELNPSYAIAHQWYGILLHEHVRFDEALIELNRAQELDPLTLFVGVTAAWPLHYRGQYDAAVKQVEKMLEMYPKDKELLGYLHLIRAESFLERGIERQAVEEYIQSQSSYGASPETIAALRTAYETSGMKGYWQKSVDLEEEKYRKESEQARRAGGYIPRPLELAKLYARIEAWDKAFAALETSFENRDENLLFIRAESIRRVSPWRGIRTDPRFVSLLRRMGLEV